MSLETFHISKSVSIGHLVSTVLVIVGSMIYINDISHATEANKMLIIANEKIVAEKEMYMSKRLDTMDKRFDRVVKRFDKIDNRLDTIIDMIVKNKKGNDV